MRINGAQGLCVRKSDGMTVSMCIGPTGRTVQIERRSLRNDVFKLSNFTELTHYVLNARNGKRVICWSGFEGLATYMNLRTGVCICMPFDVCYHAPHGILKKLDIMDPSFNTRPTAKEAMGLNYVDRTWTYGLNWPPT